MCAIPCWPISCARQKVDAVCHLAFVESDRRKRGGLRSECDGRDEGFGACIAAGVNKIVCRSSTAIYGAYPDNPAFLSEERILAGNRDRLSP